MTHMIWKKKDYEVQVDCHTGVIRSLHGKNQTVLTDERQAFGSISYTLPDDDLRTGKKPAMNPWTDRQTFWEEVSVGADSVCLQQKTLGLRGAYRFMEDHLHMEVEKTAPVCSEIAINFPFHFLGKKGGDYRTQLIPTTPYRSEDGSLRYWYLDSPEGQNLLVVARGALTWKLDYLNEICGHFITNLKWFYQLDKLYEEENSAPSMMLDIFFPDAFEDVYRILSEFLSKPVAYAQKYCCGEGETQSIFICGDADALDVCRNGVKLFSVPVCDGKAAVQIETAGVYQLIPRKGARPGVCCTVGVIKPYAELFHKNMRSLQKPYHCDRGLCEGGVWAQAGCMHQRMVGYDETVERLLNEQFEDIRALDGRARIPRCSIPNTEVDGWPAYHVYRSLRTQEAFFGVSLFIEAYRTYKNPRDLEYALGIMENLRKQYILENGEIIRRTELHGTMYHDYTTVTAPVLAVVDLARLLWELEDPRAEEYAALAIKIADYLVERGLDFPTEGGVTDLTEKEMEDGSISATALSVLYVCYWIRKKEAYIQFAKKVLALHESWCMKTPDVRLNRSTLRWWETLWEGDQDGPEICAGHAWTLWRAEADFYMGLLTGEKDAFLKSYHAFGTNLIKIDENGNSYACYQPDEIPGGGFDRPIDYRLKGGYPVKKDQSLSKYLWARIESTWWNTCVVSEDWILNGKILAKDETTIKIAQTVTPIKRIINLTACKIEK